MWRDGESFLIIEQDIELVDSVEDLDECPEPWCLRPYPGPRPPRGWSQDKDGDPNAHLLYRSLGCTRFSAELLAQFPQFMAKLPVQSWRRLDAEIFPRLSGLGVKSHCHWPHVLQHHVWNGVCACEQDHEPYPVDNEGRYAPG